MKGLLNLILGTSLIFIAVTGNATAADTTTAKTAVDSNWICTTNASSSSLAADQAADKQMADTATSAANAFAFAATNCRDCTKISCSVKN